MAVETILSFLTFPKKGRSEDPAASGVKIPLDDGKLCSMLRDIFDGAHKHCDVQVMFTSHGDKQENEVRDDLLALVKRPTVESALPLATRLEQSTTGVSGMGLLFVCIGKDGPHKRVVISRFPADEGVVAERSTDKLTVHFVDQVFLKSAYSYKAATYQSTGKPDELWFGHIVDRQINHGNKVVSDYWIVDFLRSELSTTAAAGTKRLANAIKAAITSTLDVAVKGQIAAAAQLAVNLPGKAMTIARFCENFNFAPETTRAILSKVTPARLIEEKFRFDAVEFARHIAYKQVELDNGAVLTAPADRFEECFKESGRKDERTFTTSGHVVDERLKKSK